MPHGADHANMPANSSVLDLDHLAAQTFGDHGLEADLLDLFRDQCLVLAARMRSPADPGSRADAAHTLRGSAAAVGAGAVAALCAEIEGVRLAALTDESHSDRLDAAIEAVGHAITARRRDLDRLRALAKAKGLP